MLDPSHKLYRWGPISACPLFMYFAIEPAFAPLKKLFGITYTESLIIFQDGKVTWFLDDKELGKESKKFVDSVILHAANSKKYYVLWQTRTRALTSVFDRLDKQDLSRIKNNELVTSYKQFKKAYYDWFVITISLELAASSLEPLLGERIKDQKAFSTLTAPWELTFYRREQQDLLKILLLPKQKRPEALARHQRKYYWIYNSYAKGKILERKYFEDELKKYEKTNYKKLLDEINTYTSSIRSEKAKVIRAIKPSRKDLLIIRQVELLSGLLDKRKEYNFRAEHYLELFAKEFAKRAKMSLDDVKYLLPDEVEHVFDSVDTALIRKRRDGLVFICTDKSLEEFTGNNARTIANPFLGAPDIHQGIVHGQIASTGEMNYFRGIAKIVLSINEIEKVKEGDILVTTMTSPDFVIGMKRAGAIITEVGGMLSHAAIVARELRKPCIVGTEIATKVIHDGDIVELHCGKGTVRIIKHSSM